MQSWKTPWGGVKNGLGFHVLVQSRILRQSIPHVAWTVPDFVRMPPGVSLVSPTFTLRESSAVFGRNIQWRLRLTRAPTGKGICPESDLDDLALAIEVVRPKDLSAEEMPFTIFARIENPASYAWGHNETKKVTLCREVSSVRALRHVHSVIADKNKGYLNVDDMSSVTILASVLPESHEYVTIYSLDDCRANEAADLLVPSSRTPIITLPRHWNARSQGSSQAALLQEYKKIRPETDTHTMQFWRVVMRRNNTFRPVSPELKSYEEPFYAVYANNVRDCDRGKSCLFIKVFDGVKLRFLDQVFIDREQTFADLLRRLGKTTEEFTFFEEVHSRRVDPIPDLHRTLRSHDIGDGDIVVLTPIKSVAELPAHYLKIVYTSPLVTVSPNMWHS